MADPILDVEQALLTRRSVRGFLPDPVPHALVEHLLTLAARAPSDTNIQPWHVHVLTGAPRRRLSDAILAAHAAGETAATPEYQYTAPRLGEPYLARRRKLGWALYGLLGIEKGDRAATHRQHARNFGFFGAPVGMIFTVDRSMGTGSWIDLGLFMQGLMLAARGHGLDTCAQAAFIQFHHIIRAQLDLPAEHIVACGLALGFADPDAPANRLVSEREPVAVFAKFHDSD